MDLVGVHAESAGHVIQHRLGVRHVVVARGPVAGVLQVAAVPLRAGGGAGGVAGVGGDHGEVAGGAQGSRAARAVPAAVPAGELQTKVREDFTITEKAPTRAFSW